MRLLNPAHLSCADIAGVMGQLSCQKELKETAVVAIVYTDVEDELMEDRS